MNFPSKFNLNNIFLCELFQINPCSADINACGNGGTCIALQQGRFKCECLPGWEGQNCEINIGKLVHNFAHIAVV